MPGFWTINSTIHPQQPSPSIPGASVVPGVACSSVAVRTLGLLLQGLKHSPATWGLHNPLLIALGVVALVHRASAPKNGRFLKNSWQKDPEGHFEHLKIFHFIISYAFASYKVSSCVKLSILNKLVPPGCGIVFDRWGGKPWLLAKSDLQPRGDVEPFKMAHGNDVLSVMQADSA